MLPAPDRVIQCNFYARLPLFFAYGHHLNVLVTGISLEKAVQRLTPLLVAMPVLAGSGKVSFANEASGFELSQRAGYMCTVMSKHTVDSRAMITSKDEPLSDSGVRLHVISLDTTVSRWQLILVPAIMALSGKAVVTRVGDRYAVEPLNGAGRDLLKHGAKVVLEGAERLRPGQAIRKMDPNLADAKWLGESTATRPADPTTRKAPASTGASR